MPGQDCKGDDQWVAARSPQTGDFWQQCDWMLCYGGSEPFPSQSVWAYLFIYFTIVFIAVSV